MTAAEAKVVRPRSVDPVLALGRPVMEGRNRYASNLANLLCGKHFPSIVSRAHHALPSRPPAGGGPLRQPQLCAAPMRRPLEISSAAKVPKRQWVDTSLSVSIDLPLVVTYEAVDAWSALADGTRRAIFKRLAGGPMAVGELAHGLPVSRPAVSQHLKVLKCAGLVADRAVGTRRVYQLNPKGIQELRAELDVFWTKALDAYKLIADEGGQQG
jgi:DNA-binding transcriptional ArsR family regulator